MFEGRKLIIATKHEKEKVIAPLLEKELGVKCFVDPNLDTDTLGTFTGEVERKKDPVATLRDKCLMAMELTACDLAVASEGSFGPHPSIFFVPVDDELLLFMDKKNELEIITRVVSTETNFNGAEIKNEKQLSKFIHQVKFPDHAVIIKNAALDFTHLVKGISKHDDLINTFRNFMSKYGEVYIETDMRAMHNPSRMKVIELTTKKLAAKIKNLCPDCGTPGFGITDSTKGLPCELCHFPTRSTLSYIYVCQKCNYKKEERYPNGRKTEDPVYCDVCNP